MTVISQEDLELMITYQARRDIRRIRTHHSVTEILEGVVLKWSKPVCIRDPKISIMTARDSGGKRAVILEYGFEDGLNGPKISRLGMAIVLLGQESPIRLNIEIMDDSRGSVITECR